MALTTELAVDVFPGMTPSGSFPGQFLTVNSQAYFWADDGTHGMELWRTDGTTNGTRLVMDVRE